MIDNSFGILSEDKTVLEYINAKEAPTEAIEDIFVEDYADMGSLTIEEMIELENNIGD